MEKKAFKNILKLYFKTCIITFNNIFPEDLLTFQYTCTAFLAQLLLIRFPHTTLCKSILPLEGEQLKATFPAATHHVLFPINGSEQHKDYHRKEERERMAVCRHEGGTPSRAPFYTAQGRQNKHTAKEEDRIHVLPADQLKSDPTTKLTVQL